MTKKVSYDICCDRMGIYIITEFKNGENLIEVTKHPDTKVVSDFQTDHYHHKLNAEENKSSIETEIEKKENKEYVKELKLIKSNLEKIYTLVIGNCTDGVETMLKADKEYLAKSKVFDQGWILNKVKVIVLGLETKVNKRVTMHKSIMSFMFMK